MAEFPALPIFTDAFISDTTHLSASQTGAYLMLLMIAWRTKENALPDDDAKLARWARMDKRTWAVNKSVVMSFWKLGDDHFWRQGRLTDERKYVDDKRNKNSEAGKSSALKRKERHSTGVENVVNINSTPTATPHPHLNKLADEKNDCGRNPEVWDSEILPYDWQTYAEKLNVPDEQIFRSWERFKSQSKAPWQRARWHKWIDGEKIGKRAGGAF